MGFGAMWRKSKKQGFTLVELLIVIAIIAVLVAVSIPIMTGAVEKSREAVCAANKRVVQSEIKANFLLGDYDSLQSSLQAYKVANSQSISELCPDGGTYYLKNDQVCCTVHDGSYYFGDLTNLQLKAFDLMGAIGDILNDVTFKNNAFEKGKWTKTPYNLLFLSAGNISQKDLTYNGKQMKISEALAQIFGVSDIDSVVRAYGSGQVKVWATSVNSNGVYSVDEVVAVAYKDGAVWKIIYEDGSQESYTGGSTGNSDEYRADLISKHLDAR